MAEKRKSLLDELAIKYQEESDQHREQVKSMEEKHSKEAETLASEVDQLQVNKMIEMIYCSGFASKVLESYSSDCHIFTGNL